MWTSGQVDTNDGTIAFHFMDIGEPWLERRSFPIIFQHGLGLTADVRLPRVKSLTGCHPIVTIDLRGHETVTEKLARAMMTLRDDISRAWAQATLSRWSVGRCPR